MLNTPSEHDLALRYRDGDLAAFDELYRRHSRGLYNFIAWCAPRRDRVDELVLDSWAVLHQARGRYLASASFDTFLYQVAHTRLVELARHDQDVAPAATVHDSDHDHDDAHAAPLRQAIRALADEQRETLALQLFGGLDLGEIALLCAVPLDTVTARRRDALRTLRSQLAADAAAAADPDPSKRDDFDAILRALPQETPPPELDARVHAQARAALDHPARAARDPVISAPPADADAAADDEEAPRPSNPFGHLRVPMAVAAVLVIGVTLVLQLGDWHAPADLPASAAGSPAGRASPAYGAGDPAGSIERIGALLDQHRDAEARAAWRALRQRHPDAPVPDALRARVEALPPAR